MKYIIVKHCDNGERCHCHRQEWDEVIIDEYSDEYSKEEMETVDKGVLKEYSKTNCEIYRGEQLK